MILLLLWNVVPLYAEDAAGPSALVSSFAPESPKPAQYTKEELKKRQQYRKTVENKKTEINGSQWDVELKSSDKTEKPESDTLTFQNGRFSSQFFTGKGFASTNYTITLPEGSDRAVWETMQTSSNSKEGIVFIRGEWQGEAMSGQVTQQLEGGKTKEYYFTTAKRTAIAPTTDKPSEEWPTPSAAAPASASGSLQALVSKEKAASETTPKKKQFGL